MVVATRNRRMRAGAKLSAWMWPIFGLSLAPLVAQANPAPLPPVVLTVPTGAVIKAGSAVISTPSATQMLINQSSAKAIIDWNDFSVGQGYTVQFNNGTGSTLNRVTSITGSEIDGLVSATGSVYLINSNGIVIGKTGVIKTGGSFVASGLDIADSQYLAGGDLTFSAPNTSRANIYNLGKISSLSGDVALIATSVYNDGEIDAPYGSAGLVAGYQVTLNDASLNGGRFAVQLGGAMTDVSNEGLIQAAEVELKTNQGNIYALAGNNGGSIQAIGVSAGGGAAYLVADNGSVDAESPITARATYGGNAVIETSASSLYVSSKIDAGVGGSWLLGANALRIDQNLAYAIAASLNDGTNVVQMAPAPNLGANLQILPNVTLNWATAAGLSLTSLGDIDIGAGALIRSTGGGAVTLYADRTGTGVGTVNFGAGALISTSGAVNLYYNPSDNPVGGAANGASYANATENFAASVTGGAQLTSYMLVNTLSDLQNVRNNLAGDYALGHDIDASATASWNFTLLPIPSRAHPTPTSSADLGFRPIGSQATPFTGVFLGQGHTVTGLTIDDPIDDAVGLFGATQAATISNVVLANAAISGPYTVGGLVGVQIGGLVTHNQVDSAISFTTRDYADNNPSGLVGFGGLVGYADGGQITQSLTTGSVTGLASIGGLVGRADSDTISQSKAADTVTGGDHVNAIGGLVGSASSANISASQSGGAVLGGAHVNYAGGLVGVANGGSVQTSASTATVTLGDFGSLAGGLIGYADLTTIGQSYAIGAVSVGASTQDIGGLIGSAENTTVSQSYASGAVTAGDNAAFIGGLIGATNNATLSQDYADGAVGGGLGAIDVGGLVGQLFRSSISTSYTTDAVVVGDNAGGIGGLVGDAASGSINQTYAAGAVSSGQTPASSIGGLIGSNEGASVTAGYWDTGVSGQTTSAGGTGLTTAQFFDTSNFTGFTFNRTPGAAGWVIVNEDDSLNNGYNEVGATRPLLISEYSSTIVNAHQLQLMALNLTASYKLGADIDASATAGRDVWRASGFAPIGGGYPYFTGAFDGQGHTIDGLTINQPTGAQIGLFGYASSATLKNVGLTNIDITGAYNVGGLAGIVNNGLISNTYAQGVVNGVNGAGGLIGSMDYTIVDHSYSDAAIIGGAKADFLGGLVGSAIGGAISDSYASGAVSAGDGASVLGGLVGSISDAIVAQSFATGAVNSGANSSVIGGLAGNVVRTIVAQGYATGAVTTGANALYVGGLSGGSTDSTYLQSYAAGSVTGSGNSFGLGGLIGFASGGAISNSYSTSVVNVGGPSSSVGGLVGVALTGAILQSYATGSVTGGSAVGGLAGNLGSATGVLIDGSYATGKVSGQNSVGGLVGTSDNLQVNNSYATGDVSGGSDAGGLIGFANANTVTKSYATGKISGAQGVGGFVGAILGSTISNSYASGQVIGTFDGSYIGGFAGELIPPSVGGPNSPAQTTLSQTYATGSVSVTGDANYQIGGLVGGGVSGHIVQSYATGAVDGGANGVEVGGLIGGLGQGEISGSYATGTVTGQSQLGGLAGYTYNVAITQSYATGAVGSGLNLSPFETLSFVGGLVGYETGGSIDQSYATGVIYGNGDVGGLIGFGSNISATQSYATGMVTSGSYGSNIGGLAGELSSASSVTKVYAAGDVDVTGAGSNIGGLIGAAHDGIISQSYATGAVNGDRSSNVGGLVGALGQSSNGSIFQSYATGAVFGASNLGGLVGADVGGSVTQSFATGAVGSGVASGDIGGLIGYDSNGSITQSYASGPTRGLFSIGGLVGLASGGSIAQSYAEGAVAIAAGPLGSSQTGGLIGQIQAGVTVNASYWNTQTTGQDTSADGQGLTTAQLTAALPAGFDTAVWGQVTGKSLPYLLWQFPAGAPGVLSGIVSNASKTSPLAGLAVGGIVNGNVAGSTSTGVDGYYQILTAPALNSANVLTYLTGAQKGDAFQDGVTGAASSLNITVGGLNVVTGARTLSGLISNITQALRTNGGANFLFSITSDPFRTPIDSLAMSAGANLSILAQRNFAIDQAWDLGSSALSLTASAVDVDEKAPLSAQAVNLTATTGYISLGQRVSGASSVALAAAGNVTEWGVGAIITPSLSGSAGGLVWLGGSNQITTLASFNNAGAGGFGLNDGHSLIVSGPLAAGSGNLWLSDSNTSGIIFDAPVTTGGTGYIATAGGITFDSALTIGGALQLYSNYGIGQSASSVITASALSGSAAAGLYLQGANQIAALAGFTAYAAGVTVNDARSLVVTGAVNAGPGNVNIGTTAGTLTINAPVTAAGTTYLYGQDGLSLNSAVTAHTVLLNSQAGGVTEGAAGAIDAAALNTYAVGAITLTSANVITP